MTDRRYFAPARPCPDMRWPGGAGLAVSVVVNIEEGAELSLADGDEVNEHIYEAVEQIHGAPDPCMESHFDYGPRAGWPRIRAVLASRGVPARPGARGGRSTRRVHIVPYEEAWPLLRTGRHAVEGTGNA